ncbi:MAG: PAS domain-containing protein [Pseudanabaenaceae cyanobacterium SKYGB_i_bin29]|nr:PAS domain-containing protein [Pseudanabaenaceae cyanobacterium SKYG29]MDW8421811.1 PAS domain-containing protein [Pseudanabaenaceae cyanobacterium SKYGB_i_bin29]
MVAQEYELEKQQLQEKNKILSQAQKTIRMGVWEYRLPARELLWTEEVFSIFELDPALGPPSLEEYKLMIPTTEWQQIETKLYRAITEGIGFQVEHRVITRDGGHKFVVCNAEAVKDQNGKVIKLFGVVQDITDRKKLELSLQRSQQMLAEAQRLAQVGYWEYELDGDRVEWSEETFRIFGFPISSKAPSKAEIEGRIHPDDLRLYKEAISRKIQGIEPDATDKIEMRFLLPDGTIKYTETAYNILRENGKAVKAYGSVIDITDRKLVEIALEETNRALEESNKRLQLILELNQVGTWEWHVFDNRIVWSKQKYQLMEIPQYVEPSYAMFEQILHPDDRELFREELAAAAGGSPLELEYRIQLRDGSVRWLLSKAESFHHYIAGITIDITDRKYLENSLKSQNYLLKLIASGRALDEILMETINTLEKEVYGSIGCILLTEHSRIKAIKSKTSTKIGADYLKAVDNLLLEEGTGACGSAVARKQAVMVYDIASDTRYKQFLSLTEKYNFRSCWSVPILAKDDQAIGTIVAYFHDNHIFKKYELDFAKSLADIVSIAIAKHEFEAELVASEERFRAIANNIPGVILRYILYPDGSDGLLYISPGSIDLWGVPPEEALTDVSKLWACTLEEDIPMLRASIRKSAESLTTWKHDWRTRTRDDMLKWVTGVGVPHRLDSGAVVWDTIITDVTDRKIFESELEALVTQRTAALQKSQEFLERQLAKEKELMLLLQTELRQKETLLKEVHHRVKNNLQIVSSLLRLQVENILDDSVKIALQDSQNRIQSMALIHERLYRSDDLSQIPVSIYFRELTDYLWQTYNAYRRNIELSLQVVDLQLEMDRLIPCGLIVNELVSNCLKYAFSGRERGKVTLSFYLSASQYYLQVADDGVGLPPNFNLQSSTSLGLRLVGRLVQQLHGHLEIGYDGGAIFTITFPQSP